MHSLRELIQRITELVKFVFKYRFYFFVYAFMIATRQYAIKSQKARRELSKEMGASFVQFQRQTNTFVMIVKGRSIKLQLQDAILPLPNQGTNDCQNKLAHKTQAFIEEKIPPESNLKVKIYSSKDSIYKGEIIFNGTNLSSTLSMLSLAYPINAPTEENGEINWCNLIRNQ